MLNRAGISYKRAGASLLPQGTPTQLGREDPIMIGARKQSLMVGEGCGHRRLERVPKERNKEDSTGMNCQDPKEGKDRAKGRENEKQKDSGH